MRFGMMMADGSLGTWSTELRSATKMELGSGGGVVSATENE